MARAPGGADEAREEPSGGQLAVRHLKKREGPSAREVFAARNRGAGVTRIDQR